MKDKKVANSIDKMLNDLYTAAGEDFGAKVKAMELILKYESIKAKQDPEDPMPSFFKEEKTDEREGTA